MQADLDVQLMLESKYNYLHMLRNAQAETEVDGVIIIDQLTLARNFILINAEVYGGAHEKVGPSWTLNENDPVLLTSIPLFGGQMPVPESYTTQISYKLLPSKRGG
jgi:hypothetical protein